LFLREDDQRPIGRVFVATDRGGQACGLARRRPVDHLGDLAREVRDHVQTGFPVHQLLFQLQPSEAARRGVVLGPGRAGLRQTLRLRR